MSSSANDCCELEQLSGDSIVTHLNSRFKEDRIYTYTSTVLLALNPYKKLVGYYDDKRKAEYYKSSGTSSSHSVHANSGPHPFALADLALRRLVRDKKNQAFIVSGDSGAGKTETAKVLMDFLVSAAKGTTKENDGTTKSQTNLILLSNLLLESFGNATTVRNRNSSRFGKMSTLYFNAVPNFRGAKILTYLLESSRVCNVGTGEGTFHVFYQVLSGAKKMANETGMSELLEKKAWKAVPKIGSTSGSASSSTGSKSSSTSSKTASKSYSNEEVESLFKSLLEAFSVLKFSQSPNRVFEIISGLIHLGEVEFSIKSGSNEEAVEIWKGDFSSQDCLSKSEKLLGMEFEPILLTRNVKVRGEAFVVSRTLEQAYAIKAGLAKTIYKRLFDWVVCEINTSLKIEGGTSEKNNSYIGILDIYGFERLQINSLEQLCINLANEKLQGFFERKMLVEEKRIYEKEGIIVKPEESCDLDSSQNMELNNEALDRMLAIEGTLHVLDEHNSLLRKNQKTDDKKFTVEVVKKHGTYCKKPIFSKSGGKAGKDVGGDPDLTFEISHYAGNVSYLTKDWLEKNSASLPVELEEKISNSRHDIVKELTEEGVRRMQVGTNDEENSDSDSDHQDENYTSFSGGVVGEAVGSTATTSVAKKYLHDLRQLLAQLEQTNVHYIRCFKPNGSQKPGNWDGDLVLEQLVNSGTVEFVKLMQNGYPHRVPYNSVVEKLFGKKPSGNSNNNSVIQQRLMEEDPRLLMEALMHSLEIDKIDYKLGLSRLFLKAGKMEKVEAMIDSIESSSQAITYLHTKLRLYLSKKKLSRCFGAIKFCLWIDRKYLREVKLRKHIIFLQKWSRNLARIHRACERTREKFRKQRAAACREKLAKAMVVMIRLIKILNKVRRRLSARKKVHDILYSFGYVLKFKFMRSTFLLEKLQDYRDWKRRVDELVNVILARVRIFRFLTRAVRKRKGICLPGMSRKERQEMQRRRQELQKKKAIAKEAVAKDNAAKEAEMKPILSGCITNSLEAKQMTPDLPISTTSFEPPRRTSYHDLNMQIQQQVHVHQHVQNMQQQNSMQNMSNIHPGSMQPPMPRNSEMMTTQYSQTYSAKDTSVVMSAANSQPPPGPASAILNDDSMKLRMENQLLKGLISKMCPDLHSMSGADVVNMLFGSELIAGGAHEAGNASKLFTKQPKSRKSSMHPKSRNQSCAPATNVDRRKDRKTDRNNRRRRRLSPSSVHASDGPSRSDSSNSTNTSRSPSSKPKKWGRRSSLHSQRSPLQQSSRPKFSRKSEDSSVHNSAVDRETEITEQINISTENLLGTEDEVNISRITNLDDTRLSDEFEQILNSVVPNGTTIDTLKSMDDPSTRGAKIRDSDPNEIQNLPSHLQSSPGLCIPSTSSAGRQKKTGIVIHNSGTQFYVSGKNSRRTSSISTTTLTSNCHSILSRERDRDSTNLSREGGTSSRGSKKDAKKKSSSHHCEESSFLMSVGDYRNSREEKDRKQENSDRKGDRNRKGGDKKDRKEGDKKDRKEGDKKDRKEGDKKNRKENIERKDRDNKKDKKHKYERNVKKDKSYSKKDRDDNRTERRPKESRDIREFNYSNLVSEKSKSRKKLFDDSDRDHDRDDDVSSEHPSAHSENVLPQIRERRCKEGVGRRTKERDKKLDLSSIRREKSEHASRIMTQSPVEFLNSRGNSLGPEARRRMEEQQQQRSEDQKQVATCLTGTNLTNVIPKTIKLNTTVMQHRNTREDSRGIQIHNYERENREDSRDNYEKEHHVGNGSDPTKSDLKPTTMSSYLPAMPSFLSSYWDTTGVSAGNGGANATARDGQESGQTYRYQIRQDPVDTSRAEPRGTRNIQEDLKFI